MTKCFFRCVDDDDGGDGPSFNSDHRVTYIEIGNYDGKTKLMETELAR